MLLATEQNFILLASEDLYLIILQTNRRFVCKMMQNSLLQRMQIKDLHEMHRMQIFDLQSIVCKSKICNASFCKAKRTQNERKSSYKSLPVHANL